MSITNKLNQIKNAIYGKEVRGAIHDAIRECYDDASIKGDNANMEVKMARGIHNTLNERLDKSEQKLDETNAQLSDVNDKLNNNKVLNVLDYGLKEGDKSFNNTPILKSILTNYGERLTLYFPKGDYYFSSPMVIKNIDIKGDGFNTNLIFKNTDKNETFILFGGNRCSIEDIRIKSNDRNHDLKQKGLVLGQKNECGEFSYSNRISLCNVEIENFETSLAIEGVYTVDLTRVYTYKDVYGFTVNKQLYTEGKSESLVVTSILCNHLYNNGTGGAYTQPTGSIGWELYEVSDITLNNCVSELYEKSFYMTNVNNCQMNTPYFENTLIDNVIDNITGSVTIINPYINSVSSSDSSTSFIRFNAVTRLLMIGGRVVGLSKPLINKTNDSQVTIIQSPVTNAVTSTSGWDQSGVTYLEKNTLRKTCRSKTEYGLDVSYFGTGLQVSPTSINQRSSNESISFKIKDNEQAKITTDGFLEVAGNSKGLYLYDYNGQKYKVFVKTTGELTTVLES